MAEDGGSGAFKCCWFCFTLILCIGLIALIFGLSARTSDLYFSINQFYVPALNGSDTSSTTRSNHSIVFDLRLKNGNKNRGVNYAAVNLTFFYFQNSSRLLIASHALPGFYQGEGKTAKRKGVVPVEGVPWAAVIESVSNRSTARFRVEMATGVRFRILFFHTKRRRVAVGGNVTVDASGGIPRKKKIALKSGAVAVHRVGTMSSIFLTLCLYILFK